MESSLANTAQALRTGQQELLSYLNEVEAHFEKREPEVLAFMPEEGRFERMRHDAEALLERYPEIEGRPALFGVTVGIKDIFHADGFATKGGSKLPPERLAGTEAESVTRLKEAGALILGKAVTTEFAYFGPGPTRNPHNPEHTPGGSSSGSAAGVAAGLCLFALGTQTIGSINRPAAFCGAVGYKPSYERVSRAGVIPLSPSVDHIGGFSSDVAGLRLVATVLVHEWQDSAVRGKPVMGVLEGPYIERADAEGIKHFGVAVRRLADAGFAVKMVRAMTDYDDIYERHQQLVAAEAAQVHREWYAEFKSLYHFKTVGLIERGLTVSDDALAEALKGRARLRGELTALMDEQGVDVLVAPPAPGAAPKGLESTGDPVMNLPWTHSGVPSITVPAGLNEAGMPMGLQVVGRFGGDEDLINWSESIEQSLRGG